MLDIIEFKKRINDTIRQTQQEMILKRFEEENYQVFAVVNKR